MECILFAPFLKTIFLETFFGKFCTYECVMSSPGNNIGREQNYSRLLLVKGLAIFFFFCWSCCIFQFRQNIIDVTPRYPRPCGAMSTKNNYYTRHTYTLAAHIKRREFNKQISRRLTFATCTTVYVTSYREI